MTGSTRAACGTSFEASASEAVMNTVRTTATLAALSLLTACGGTTVNQGSATATGTSTSSSSSSSGSSTSTTTTSSESTTSAPSTGTKVSGDTIAGQIRTGIQGQAGVKFKEGRRDATGSLRTSTLGTANGEFAIKDPLTGKYNDTSSRQENTVVVGGVAYGYYRKAAMWVKAGDNPSSLELSFKSAYTAQLCKLDPRVIIEMVSGGDGESKGEVDVDGVKTTRYTVTNTLAKLMEKQVNAMKQHGCDVLAVPSNKSGYDNSMKRSGSKIYTFDVYLDPQGKLIRYDEPTSGTSSSRTSITYTDWGTAVNPTPPADAKTFDEARSKATGSSGTTSATKTASA